MDNILIKPYEISVWDDIYDNTLNRFVEKKLAIIGSNVMTGLNAAYNPVFHKKLNGEKTLTFTLKYKYYDPYLEQTEVVNPFINLLVNERKVKLFYDNEWYEFIVKDHTESSDGLEWIYTCTDAFILELSKSGYHLTFDTELNNNQGTAVELAKKTLENTDWRLKETDPLKQLIAEPIYKAQLIYNNSLIIKNIDTEETFSESSNIYLFYSFIKNQSGKFVQFIIHDEYKDYVIDDNNVITDTNYRILTELEYVEETNENDEVVSRKFVFNGQDVIIIQDLETRFQANRLAYNQLTTYDPVMERTVNRFKVNNAGQIEDREIYKYSDFIFTTSNVVTNYITNGDNFNVLENGSLQGWSQYVEKTGTDFNQLCLTTRPELSTDKNLANLVSLSQIDGFLEVVFKNPFNNYKNGIYNSGIDNNCGIIKSISKGEQFVFRYRAARGSIDNLQSVSNLRLVVAKCITEDPVDGYAYKKIDTDNIILDFHATQQNPARRLNNIIDGGEVEGNTYKINGIDQIISTKYIYRNNNGGLYAWDNEAESLVLLDNEDDFELPYYYLLATAQQSVSNKVLTDPTENFGIFLFYESGAGSQTYYIQDIQLTRYIPDVNEQPVLIGNIPTTKVETVDYYYFEPPKGATAEETITFNNLNSLQEHYNITNKTIVPLYNENSEKTLSISVSQSNCFNILQTIAETFQCWVDLEVDHDELGYITYTDNKPNKFISLREYAGKENWSGFKYGININSIERTVNSDEVVTKLIVDFAQSDYTDDGYVSIASAPSNNSGESYILNFEYYYNQGLLDRDVVEADKIKFITEVADLNKQLTAKQKEYNDLSITLEELNSKRNVYTELVEAAQTEKAQAMDDFYKLTDVSYDEYRKLHPTLTTDDKLTEEETILKILGKLYTTSATINNYSGILTNVNSSYWDTRGQLYGSENYYVKVWVAKDINQVRHVFVELNDYLDNFNIVIDNEVYITSTSQKYFDIITDANIIEFSYADSDYTIEEPTYVINDNIVKKIRIKSETSIPGLQDEIEDLLEKKNKLVNNFNNKYSRFIQEGTWNSTDYIDSELYYLDAVQVSNTSAQPLVSYTINVVEISELEGYQNYLFDIGDKTYIEDTEFFGWTTIDGILTPAREEVIVSEVDWNLENPSENVITVQNYKTRFEDLFQRINAAVQTVQYNEATYAKISSLVDSNGTINQNVLLASLNNISGQPHSLTSDGSVLIDGDNILIRNLTNATNLVRINSEGIRVSSDGGLTWTTALDGRGINVDTVYTGTLNTDNIIIGNKNAPSFRWDKSGISAYSSMMRMIDGVPTETYDLKKYVRFDEYGLYGIKNGKEHFKAQNIDEIKENAHFAITWDGFFIKNSYPGGGRVEITSDNDFRVLNTLQGESEPTEKIKIGALEWMDSQGTIYTNIEEVPSGVLNQGPSLYGIRIKGQDGEGYAFKADDLGNLEITGTINALDGIFSGLVQVGTGNPYIAIDGEEAVIQTSNFNEGAALGWKIDKDGNTVFNNITARGAIKTAVFEYAEIQAVGGVFLFRPSSTIKTATVSSNGEDIVVTVEKPLLFKEDEWCKISNYAVGDDTTDGEAANPDAIDILDTNGLVHVYPISHIAVENGRTYFTLSGAAAMLTDIDKTVDSLVGGALVDMGNREPVHPNDPNSKLGTNNYGIGINSSDNTVNLPARAISLFETKIDDNAQAGTPKVTYEYQAILGTLPELSYQDEDAIVDELYHDYLENTQGLYTDNIYLGDNNQYLTFYTDNEGNKKLRIKAAEILYELNGDYVNVNSPAKYIWYDDNGGHVASGVPNPSGQGMIPFNPKNEQTFGYNSLMATDKLALRYNEREFVYIDQYGLNINNSAGQIVATYGETIKLGEGIGEVYLEIDYNGLSFKNSSGHRVSYLDANKLYIPDSVVLNEMVVGTRDQRTSGQNGEAPVYKRTNDDSVVANTQYYEKKVENRKVTYKAITDPSSSAIPSALKWFVLDTSDLWAWRVGYNEHLRLVWKGEALRHKLI